MSNSFNGYSLFKHIKDANLRTYNRVNTYFNMVENHGKAPANSYLKNFNKTELFQIYTVMIGIQRDGFEQFRRDFMRMAA